jgi:hypothetical protein
MSRHKRTAPPPPPPPPAPSPWLDRPPTLAEVAAHHAAHANTHGFSLWVLWLPGAKVPVLHYSTGVAVPPCSACRARPLDADAVACQVLGRESADG